MCALRIVKHLTKIYYHNIPLEYEFDEDLQEIQNLRSGHPVTESETPSRSLLPHRDALTDLMAQLPASDFPELIEQILIENHNHTRGDITDGPGDQSRDIHTITPDGEKHLTQCRHTENPYKSNLDRHDLDELWSATGRLRYDKGLLVTNADMTTPAKANYVNGDYEREGYPELKIWNDRDLWDEIRDNQNLLNRWFSGLAQLHSVKRFSFRALPVRMPDREPADIKECIEVFKGKLREDGYTVERSGISWKIENEEVIIFAREWFASASNLFMPCTLKAPHDLVTAPFSIIEFHVINKTSRSDYENVREFLCSTLLESFVVEEGSWISMLSSPLMAPVYIHDTEDVVVTGIKPYTSFVSVAGEFNEELVAALSIPDEYKNLDGDELVIANIESGILVSFQYSQPLAENSDDTIKIISYKAIETFKKSIVFEVSYNNDFEYSMALAGSNFTTLVLEDPEEKKLYFCFERIENHDELKAELKEFLHSLRLQKIVSKPLEKEGLIDLFRRIENELEFEVQSEKGCNTRNGLALPINIKSRVITCIIDIDVLDSSVSYDALFFELFKYKMTEQNKCGYDEGFKIGENEMSFRQLKNILWRPTKMTGRESINIGIRGPSGSIRLMIYFKPNRIELLVDAIDSCHKRTLEHIENIRSFVTKSKKPAD